MKRKRILQLVLTAVFAAVTVCSLASCGGGKGKTEEENLEAMGTFYSLQEAFDNGFLTQEDLKSIAYHHNEGREGNEAVMDENYVPQPKTPEVLSEETKTALRQTYWVENYKDSTSVKVSDIFERYYGSYNGYVAVKIYPTNVSFSRYWEVTIGGVLLKYRDTKSITIFKLKES